MSNTFVSEDGSSRFSNGGGDNNSNNAPSFSAPTNTHHHQLHPPFAVSDTNSSSGGSSGQNSNSTGNNNGVSTNMSTISNNSSQQNCNNHKTGGSNNNMLLAPNSFPTPSGINGINPSWLLPAPSNTNTCNFNNNSTNSNNAPNNNNNFGANNPQQLAAFQAGLLSNLSGFIQQQQQQQQQQYNNNNNNTNATPSQQLYQQPLSQQQQQQTSDSTSNNSQPQQQQQYNNFLWQQALQALATNNQVLQTSNNNSNGSSGNQQQNTPTQNFNSPNSTGTMAQPPNNYIDNSSSTQNPLQNFQQLIAQQQLHSLGSNINNNVLPQLSNVFNPVDQQSSDPVLPSSNNNMNSFVVPNGNTSSMESAKAPKRPRLNKCEGSIISSNNSAAPSWDMAGPPVQKTDAELAKMTPAERRRHERNMREQQRSYRISQQIKQLRDVLSESNIPFKPNKFSILVCVVDYIKQLQQRAIMLDSEHKKLVGTIRQTNDAVSSGQQIPTSEDESQGVKLPKTVNHNDWTSELLTAQGINYCAVFNHCPFPLGVASLDGRLLAYNTPFKDLFGLKREDQNQKSFFVYIRNHQDIFEAMSGLLKKSAVSESEDQDKSFETADSNVLYWVGSVVSLKSEDVPFTITLTNSFDGQPKFFSFSAANTNI